MRRAAFGILAAILIAACVAVSRNLPWTNGSTLVPGPAAKGNFVMLPNSWKITPAGRQIELPGDLVLKMIPTPDGKSLVVNTGGYHDHSVSLITLQSEKIASTVDVGKNWCGMALNSSTGTLFVSGGGAPGVEILALLTKQGLPQAALDATHKPILRLSLGEGRLNLQGGLSITGLQEKDRFIAGTLVGPDGALFVVNTENDTVYRLSGNDFGTQIAVKVGYHPYAAALSPDGNLLAVSNWGDESVSFLKAKTLQLVGTIKVGSHPNELLFGKDGRLYVANSGSNSVSVIRGDKVIETVKTSLNPKDPVGSTPDGLALSPDGKRLYVANADNNNVAVIDIADARESKILGFIPTGWYPSSVAVSNDGQKLFIGTGKGLRFRRNYPAQVDASLVSRTPNPKTPYDYIGRVLGGAVSIVDVPDKNQLEEYTRQVIANTPQMDDRANQSDVARIQKEVFSKIKHVLYIIRENRTYDQVFGDLGVGNGDPNLTLFDESVTPNAHQLAKQTVVLDNLYCNGEVSEDGHQWCNAAYATDFTQRAWPSSYSKRGEPHADERLTASPAGYLWDNCARRGLTYRSYGEFASFTSSPEGEPKFKGTKGLEGHASIEWDKVKRKKESRDTDKAEVFITELKEAEKSDVWPQFMVMSLGEDHTEGLSAGKFTPVAHVAANDQALGKIVEAISHSRFWAETAIFVIEDDAQNGPDHVDAHRTVGLVLSPYVKRGVVDSTMYTTVSMLRTIELILGLPPMTQYDRNTTAMYNCFTTEPSLAPYTNLSARVDLEARNPMIGPGVRSSARLDFSDIDRADPDALNQILWQAIKGDQPMPAPVHSARIGR